ncbi:MAG: hypothetical protein OEY22_08310 [Candidatus Bathyarchaeota archaeon]|nr:hypothetical protein [Candidatus Bathyarchaeota archaeon]
MQIRGSKGQMVNAEQLSFKVINEGFSEYELSDGRIMKMRVILAEVYRLDEKEEAIGRDNYFVKSVPVVSVEEKK